MVTKIHSIRASTIVTKALNHEYVGNHMDYPVLEQQIVEIIKSYDG